MEAARIRISISWVFAAVGGAIGAAVGLDPHAQLSPVLTALLGAYVAWALYWGVPPVWRGWCGLFRNAGCFVFTTPMGWLLLLLAFFYIPLVGGYLYGVLGGAVYEFVKYRRLSMGASPRSIWSPQREPSLAEMLAEQEARRSYMEDSARNSNRFDASREAEPQENPGCSDSEMSPEQARSILGVSAAASKDEIQSAFREQIKKYHPDRVAHLGEEFRRIAERKSTLINKAYEILAKWRP